MNNEPATKRILLVDDDTEMLKALAFALEKAGYHVTVQSSASSALDYIQTDTTQFDLVITDISMPGLRGLPFLTALKTAFPSMPVIVITAFGDWGQYERALSEGAFEFLTKPVDKAQLLDCVRRAMAGEPAGQQASPPWDAN